MNKASERTGKREREQNIRQIDILKDQKEMFTLPIDN
jgi:hypothetical protein